MYSTTLLLSALSGLALVSAQTQETANGALGSASVINDNPSGEVYVASFRPTKNSDIGGTISAMSNANGTGVIFTVSLSNFPDPSLGPFLYHIHDQPVPSDGNCTKTLAHQDPYIRGETPPCDPRQPETCQVGDLSGKHGKINSDPFDETYLELYAGLKPGIGSFFGNRSITLHLANKTRINCANFKQVVGRNGSAPTGTGSLSSTSPSPTRSPPAASTNGAALRNGASVIVVLGAMVAFFL